MMKIEIYDARQEAEPVIRLKLFPNGINRIAVCVVDEKGHRLESSDLVHISSKGINRCRNVNPGLGFNLSGIGRLFDVSGK